MDPPLMEEYGRLQRRPLQVQAFVKSSHRIHTRHGPRHFELYLSTVHFGLLLRRKLGEEGVHIDAART